MVEVVKEYGEAGSLTYFPNMIKKELDAKDVTMSGTTANQMTDAKRIV